MHVGPKEHWITDRTMPMVAAQGLNVTARFYKSQDRIDSRAHYTKVRMMAGYHMNDNQKPPFHWAK